MINVGDPAEFTYSLDGTVPELAGTVVTGSLTYPGGSVSPLAVINETLGRWVASWTFTEPGEYFVSFTAAGSLLDHEKRAVLVVDPAVPGRSLEPPAWAPTLEDVAAHIPTRTREVGVSDEYLRTFTDDTTPTAGEVDILIGHACAWVTGRVGTPIAAVATPACRVAAALWAAYWVELAYPERDADVQVYDRLRPDAEDATTAAGGLNDAAGGGDETDSDPMKSLLTVHSFPLPVAYGDLPYL